MDQGEHESTQRALHYSGDLCHQSKENMVSESTKGTTLYHRMGKYVRVSRFQWDKANKRIDNVFMCSHRKCSWETYSLNQEIKPFPGKSLVTECIFQWEDVSLELKILSMEISMEITAKTVRIFEKYKQTSSLRSIAPYRKTQGEVQLSNLLVAVLSNSFFNTRSQANKICA